MEKRNIGKSGLSAPFLGLGTWAIGGGSWWGDNDDALSVKAIETAVEQGITWIDTAPIYGLYHSEEVVGEALRHIDRDKVILSTKCGLEWRHESPVLHKVVDGVPTLGFNRFYAEPTAPTLSALVPGKAIYIVMTSGGDITPGGHFASPVQMSYLMENGRLVGRLPELNIGGDFSDFLGNDYIGAVRGDLSPDSMLCAVVMDVNM